MDPKRLQHVSIVELKADDVEVAHGWDGFMSSRTAA